MLSLLHLPTIKTHGKEPLIDYSQSHVVTSNEYLNIMYWKAMEKEVAETIREPKGRKSKKS
jgi:hypothetical protein